MIVLVVGTGLTGSTAARMLAAYGHDVVMFESRNHIGGNVYTTPKDGYYEHTYGPHIFHTSNKNAFEWMNMFGTLVPYIYSPTAVVSENNHYQHVKFPLTKKSLSALFGENNLDFISKEIQTAKAMFPYTINQAQQWLTKVGRTVYRLFFEHYSKKQWGVDSSELLPTLGHRVPFTLEDAEPNYFPNDTYQALPKNGYTEIITNMLQHSKIEICNEKWLPNKFDQSNFKIIYTGKLDEFYNYDLGELPYRTLTWITGTARGYSNSVYNICHETLPYTRVIIDQMFLDKIPSDRSVQTRQELPAAYDRTNPNHIPMYPMPTPQARDLANAYRKRKTPNVFFGGRLGGYKYINMDAAVLEGMKLAKQVMNE